MPYPCELKDYPDRYTLTMRTRTSIQNLPQFLGAAYGRIANYIAELGMVPVGVPFATYYNMNMQDIDVEVGFPVSEDLPGKDQIQPCLWKKGLYATTTFTGPYRDLGPAYKELNDFVTRSGHQTTGIVTEFYLNDPANTPQEDLKTEIEFQLQ